MRETLRVISILLEQQVHHHHHHHHRHAAISIAHHARVETGEQWISREERKRGSTKTEKAYTQRERTITRHWRGVRACARLALQSGQGPSIVRPFFPKLVSRERKRLLLLRVRAHGMMIALSRSRAHAFTLTLFLSLGDAMECAREIYIDA